MKKTLQNLFCGLSFILAIFCNVASRADEVKIVVLDDGTVQALAEQLESVFRPRIRTLDREMITFHYEGKNENFKPQNLSDLQRKIFGAGDKFFDVQFPGSDMVGPGTYVAIDDFSSRSFGGLVDPQLYVIPIRKHARLINLSGSFQGNEKSIVSALLTKFPCVDGDLRSKLSSLTEVPALFRNSSSIDCRKIIVRAFNDLGVQGVIYAYDAANLSGCRSRGEAINIISANIVNGDGLALFSDATQIGDSRLADNLMQLFRESGSDFSIRITNEDNVMVPPATLARQSISPPAYELWKSQNIFKCGQKWAAETSTHYEDELNALARRTYFDPEIQELILSTRHAFTQRFSEQSPAVSFKLANMNQLELIAYQLSEMAPDNSKFENWKKAKDMAVSFILPFEVRNPAIEALLDESQFQSNYNFEMADDEFARSVNYSIQKQPGLMLRYLKKQGLGPRYSAILSDFFYYNFGVAPSLTKAAAQDIDQRNVALAKTNREAFKSILLSCRQEYSNPTLTLELIQQGPCGIRKD